MTVLEQVQKVKSALALRRMRLGVLVGVLVTVFLVGVRQVTIGRRPVVPTMNTLLQKPSTGPGQIKVGNQVVVTDNDDDDNDDDDNDDDDDDDDGGQEQAQEQEQGQQRVAGSSVFDRPNASNVWPMPETMSSGEG